MLAGGLEYVANGDINPCRFCKIDTSVDGKILEAGAATDQCIGISQEGTRNVPYSTLNDGLAAKAGEAIKIFRIGETCLLEVSAAVARGDRLKPSAADGRGQTALIAANAYALALKTAAGAGVKIPVLVIFDTGTA